MKLYLIRHAEADDNHIDYNRQLTPKGREQMRVLGERLVASEVFKTPPRVVSSALTRGRQSAELLCEVLGITGSPALWNDLSPESNPQNTLTRINTDKSHEDLMIVGHNPHLTILSSILLCGERSAMRITFKKAGCLCLERGHSSGRWTLRWYLVPAVT